MNKFNVLVSYSQIIIFDVSLHNPGNEWSNQHLNQGFSYREGSVSFGTSLDGGNTRISVYINEQPISIGNNSTDAIIVPFKVINSKLKIGGLFDNKTVDIENGNYELFYEVGIIDENNMFCNIYFNKKEKVEPKIIKLQSQYKPTYPLLMDAKPA